MERLETLPRPGQRKYKMGLKYLLVPESKEVLTGEKKKKKRMTACHRGIGIKLEKFPIAKTGAIRVTK